MTHTFYLKKPNEKGKTLILFSCYFKEDNKKFVYSTGEKIDPKAWSFEDKTPKMKGKNKCDNATSIKSQLSRYSRVFELTENKCRIMDVRFTPSVLKEEFDKEFKKVSAKKNLFLEVYGLFMKEKQMRKEWKPATIKRYNNLRNHLISFERSKRYKLTFSNINNRFYTEYLDFCYEELDHYSNTVARNIGLFKTFMYWALKEKHTYNDKFVEFEKPRKVITKEEALTLEQVNNLFSYNFDKDHLIKARDLFVFQCLTGMRYGELKLVNERIIENGMILLKEEKDVSKPYREIPLMEVSNYILKKYSYSLPVISNQKQNEYIKEILRKAGYDYDVEYTKVKGKMQKKFIAPFYQRCSTHTARRTYITVVREYGIDDKTVMSITGHRDLKTFQLYHKISSERKLNVVKNVFKSVELPNLKKA